jgi:hypothetical protein
MNSFDFIEVSTIGVINNIYVYLKCRFSDCLVVTFFHLFSFLNLFIHFPLFQLYSIGMATNNRVLEYSLGRPSTRVKFSYSNTRLTFLSLDIFPFIFLFEIFSK